MVSFSKVDHDQGPADTPVYHLIARIVVDGVAQGSIRRDIDPQAVATLIIATLEGGILLARAHQSAVSMQHTVDHLVQYVRRDVAA